MQTLGVCVLAVVSVQQGHGSQALARQALSPTLPAPQTTLTVRGACRASTVPSPPHLSQQAHAMRGSTVTLELTQACMPSHQLARMRLWGLQRRFPVPPEHMRPLQASGHVGLARLATAALGWEPVILHRALWENSVLRARILHDCALLELLEPVNELLTRHLALHALLAGSAQRLE